MVEDISLDQRATSESSTFDEQHPVRPILRDDILCDTDSSSSSVASLNNIGADYVGARGLKPPGPFIGGLSPPWEFHWGSVS